MQQFTQIFLVALLAHVATQLWLSGRQVAHVAAHRGRVPAAFAASVTPDEHSRAADYTVARQRLSMLESVTDAAVVVGMTIGGGTEHLYRALATLGFGDLATQTLLVLAVVACLGLVGLPYSLFRTFAIEQRFGFNRTTFAVYVADAAKGIALGGLIGGLIIAIVIALMTRLGDDWWIAGWVAWTAFTLLLTWAWPRIIAPLFNRFSPLDDANLRDRIEALLVRCGFRTDGLYVMDGCRRSSHGNAYFTGLGRTKRIVFFDTLLSALSPDEVESVLAHELGHFRLRHVPQRLLVSLVASLAGFALLGWLAGEPGFYSALGVSSPGPGAALVLFMLAIPAFTWLLSPVAAAWSRRHEFEADAYAARHASARALSQALVKLYRDNASTLTPDPVHSAFHDSHPSPAARIERLDRLSALDATVPG